MESCLLWTTLKSTWWMWCKKKDSRQTWANHLSEVNFQFSQFGSVQLKIGAGTCLCSMTALHTGCYLSLVWLFFMSQNSMFSAHWLAVEGTQKGSMLSPSELLSSCENTQFFVINLRGTSRVYRALYFFIGTFRQNECPGYEGSVWRTSAILWKHDQSHFGNRRSNGKGKSTQVIHLPKAWSAVKFEHFWSGMSKVTCHISIVFSGGTWRFENKRKDCTSVAVLHKFRRKWGQLSLESLWRFANPITVPELTDLVCISGENCQPWHWPTHSTAVDCESSEE